MPLQLGDRNESVRRWRHVMNARFGPLYTRLQGPLPEDTDEFGPRARAWQQEYERRTLQPVDGIVSDDDLRALKIAIPAARPIIFTVEGHLSNMFFGPAADTATQLEQQGVCWHQPVGYNNAALPFDNRSGINELARLVGSTDVNGRPFPPGTPWGLVSFSQGAMIASDFMAQQVLPENGPLRWRLNDFRRGLAFGNPRREQGKCCPWAQSPPPPGTHGIMDKLFVTTGTPIADRWQEHPNSGDMFAAIGNTQADKDKTAIAKIVTENSWIGGEAALFARVLNLFGDPVGGSFAAIRASFEAIKFLASNPNPHYSTISTPGDVEWMRGVALQAAA